MRFSEPARKPWRPRLPLPFGVLMGNTERRFVETLIGMELQARRVTLGWTWADRRGSTSELEFDLKVGFTAVNLGCRTSAVGRERQFATFGCSRSAAILSRSPVDTRE